MRTILALLLSAGVGLSQDPPSVPAWGDPPSVVAPPADPLPAWLPKLPAGMHYVRCASSPCGWHGVKIGSSPPAAAPTVVPAKASEVAHHPFPQEGPGATTRTTGVTPAGGASTRSPGSTGTGRTPTYAFAVTHGVIDQFGRVCVSGSG